MPRPAAILALLIAIAPATAQPRSEPVTLTGEAPATHKRLLELQQRIEAGEDVLNDLVTLINASGDDLVRTERPDHFVAARQQAQKLIARLPDAQRTRYRLVVDAAAKRLLAKADTDRSTRPLVDLIEQYEHSTPAQAALLKLGDRQYESGQIESAEATWRRLAEIADSDNLRKRRELLLLVKKLKPLPGDRMGRWESLAGDGSRSGKVASRLPAHWPSEPTWRVELPSVDRIKRPDLLANSAPRHPVVLGERIYLADATSVVTVPDNPINGARVVTVFTSSLPDDPRPPKAQAVDFTLTVAHESLYGRFGATSLWANSNPDEEMPVPASELVRLVPERDGSLKAVWTMPAPPNAVWLGAPAVADNRIVAASVRKSGNKRIYAIHAYDEGGPLWTRTILECECPPGDPPTRHDLVAIAEDTVVFNTNAGATVALDVRSGRPLWAWKYPRLIPSGKALAMAWTANHRDISPPIVHDGVVVVAPTDTARLAGIELRSGRMLWEQTGYHVETVIGVGDRKVVVVMAGPVRGLRAFDLRTGSDEWPDGWTNHDDPGLASLGRGLVSDDLVLWPTRTALYTLDLKTGRPARLPVLGPHGNLAFARGMLIVANPTELRGYVGQESNRPTER